MTKYFSTFLLLFVAAGTSKAQTCNRNGGSSMTFDGECTSRNYTWTDQCIITQKDGMCITTAEKCGCQVIYESGDSSAIGSGSIDGCDNACVTISDDVPKDRTCQASGSAMSFDTGSCDSRNYTYTSACNFAEEVDAQVKPTKCTITANSCGCLYWEEDSEYVSGLAAPDCDACAGPGSGAPCLGLALKAVSAALMSAVWFVL
mmetsp:Transcript_7368/g.16708  ORF Transcript_7368/g.16708 Transcript_7368/m.16708 type:complete len:203 (+) Transcript_7368:61-669(+)|eukprot:CAMPEP_0172299636 /NCGR_PEP_ID=MMETSP1058-20130122/1898_1 /TAXON_ID=83371 /ORGANISM="Detonula confervacea, Strain CCMP 353" /LENGTH=202 /DNA_ID=CAMNT_0013009153 /DNA_START=40 /DNA_END=648 /DNA_ORIENTATION=-